MIKQYNIIFALMILVLYSACSKGDPHKHVLKPIVKSPFESGMSIEFDRNLPLLNQRQEVSFPISYREDDKKGIAGFAMDIDSLTKSDYRYIQLETSEECIIGEVYQLFTDDSLIFVVDRRHENVFCFDYEGHYKNKIGERGKSGEEYASLFHAAIDRNRKEICIQDFNGRKLLFYTYEGTFKRSEPMYLFFDGLEFIGNNRVLYTLQITTSGVPELEGYKLVMTNDKGIPTHGILPNPGFPARRMVKKNKFTSFHSRTLRSCPDGVYFSDILSPDTIWQINEKECIPICSIDYGPENQFCTLEEYRNMDNETYNRRINEVKHLGERYEFSKRFIYVGLETITNLIIDRETGKYKIGRITWYTPDKYNLLDITVGHSYYPIDFVFDWEKDEFVKVMYADDIIHIRNIPVGKESTPTYKTELYQTLPKEEKELLDNVSLEDNPILVVFSFNPIEKTPHEDEE